jgi:2-polyprenyl-3-methyl-5-hydroxy-6-metoxy-1,4-benzoquinol methylase
MAFVFAAIMASLADRERFYGRPRYDRQTKTMNLTSQAPGPASPFLVMDLLSGYQRTSALHAAIDLDLFRAVGEGPGDVGSLARHCQASERGIRILCDYLTVFGLLQKEDGHYRHTPTSAAFLDPRSPACLASAAHFLAGPPMHAAYGHMTDAVRHGRTALPGQGNVEPENPVWVEFANGMAPLMAPLAGPLASLALEGRKGPVRVLDIAAGHGLFGIEIALQEPDARIVALDWPKVLEVAAKNAAKAGVDSRYELLPGSAFDVPYGGPYDIVLLTNFLHHFDVDTCTRLLRRIHDSCAPGAVVATLEFVPNEDRVSPAPAAAFSLVMLASTVAGDAYTFSELESMYRNAGFSQITAQAIPDTAHTVVLGNRG